MKTLTRLLEFQPGCPEPHRCRLMRKKSVYGLKSIMHYYSWMECHFVKSVSSHVQSGASLKKLRTVKGASWFSLGTLSTHSDR